MGGGQDQQDRRRSRSIRPEAKTNKAVWSQGQKLGARIHRTADRANSETNINQKTKKPENQPSLDKYQGHILSSWDNTLVYWFFGFLVAARALLHGRRSGPMGPEVKVNTARSQNQQGWVGPGTKAGGPGSTGPQTPIQKTT